MFLLITSFLTRKQTHFLCKLSRLKIELDEFAQTLI